ncbi:MAG: Adenosylcobinamide-phosphate guanylyltransferase [Euryarchaeota archaeon ADurb.Bin165]|jgi:adenosylcobinamide-phosphate guanylyltransferase|nr:MAG: Adenosylcobinamide-phosphate guanylyltransferase [Euryarchaeota archaeon ADurb.Bin165]
MFALIMAGGKASRLGMGEKALARIHDRPMISYVINAVIKAGLTPVVIVTPLTPYTTNYCRIQDILWLCTDGTGYVEDIWQAVEELSINGPFLTICADLPGICAEHITMVLEKFESSGCPACSVWVPHHDGAIDDDLPGIPAGINILDSRLGEEEQEEVKILIKDPILRMNINTREDLEAAEKMLSHLKSPDYQPTLL